MGHVCRSFLESRGIIRQVEVKAANGTYKQSIARLFLVRRGDVNITLATSVAAVSKGNNVAALTSCKSSWFASPILFLFPQFLSSYKLLPQRNIKQYGTD